MVSEDAAIDKIKVLEARRYQAMLDGDTTILDALCSDDLIYRTPGATTMTSRATDKVDSGHFTYLEITHPAEHPGGPRSRARGWMTARCSVAANHQSCDNGSAVDTEHHIEFAAYQPTPIISHFT